MKGPYSKSTERIWVYMLLCADKSYYTGVSSQLEQRVGLHQAGLFPGYTQSRLPVKLVWSQEFRSLEEAFRLERQIKGWSRAKKKALISGDFDALHELAKCRNSSASPGTTSGTRTCR